MSAPDLPEKPPTSLRSDEPIRNRDQDKLARGHLAEVIAAHIVKASGAPESVVIAVNAPWGAGKSSFLNLLEEQLVPTNPSQPEVAGAAVGRPIVVRFNPWNYTNVDQLVRMFFGEMARALGTARNKKLAKKIGNLLQAVGSVTAIFSSGIGNTIKDAAGVVKQEQSLPDLKRELQDLLPDLSQRVVVFVDDIDRLERDTLRLLFRVIRLNADFPNVTYVLAFDRMVVEKNLDEESGIRGRDYLEKIIQVSFDIPAPEASTTHRILFAEMDAVIESLKTKPLDDHRWGNAFHSGFKEHFRTIRHIKRYANGLRLTLAPVAQEVDLVDFLGIELLRTFHPEVYLGVAKGKDMLAPRYFGDREGVPKEDLRKWVEELCSKASPGFENSVRGLLQKLFPELDRAYKNTTYGDEYKTEWRRACRACAPDVFDKFFLLAIPEGDVSDVELQRFVTGLADATATSDRVRASMESGKVRRLLERLEDYTDDLSPVSATNLVVILFDLGDELRFESRGILDGGEFQVPRLVYQSLGRLATPRERQDLLLRCVRQGAALFTLVQETSFAEPREAPKETEIFSDQMAWEVLRDAAVARIRDAETSGVLWKTRRLPYVLYHWTAWTNEVDVKAAVARYVSDEANLIRFLGQFLTTSQSQTVGDEVGRKHVRIDKKSLRDFSSLEELKGRLQEISGRGGEGAEGVLDVLNALERKGRPWEE